MHFCSQCPEGMGGIWHSNVHPACAPVCWACTDILSDAPVMSSLCMWTKLDQSNCMQFQSHRCRLSKSVYLQSSYSSSTKDERMIKGWQVGCVQMVRTSEESDCTQPDSDQAQRGHTGILVRFDSPTHDRFGSTRRVALSAPIVLADNGQESSHFSRFSLVVCVCQLTDICTSRLRQVLTSRLQWQRQSRRRKRQRALRKLPRATSSFAGLCGRPGLSSHSLYCGGSIASRCVCRTTVLK